MVRREITWARTADIQFIGILDYWVKKNKSNTYAKKLLQLVAKTTEQIAKNPQAYKSTDYKNIRVASLGHFSIYYQVIIKYIIVLAFWDNRQDPKKLVQMLKHHK
jgi:plasmid stabilization system protein ParE